MTRRRGLLAAALALVALVVAPLGARADTAEVEVHDNYFAAQRIVINPGDTVHWTVVGNGHTITADDGSFDFPDNDASGGELFAGDQASHTFTAKGVFYYHCNIHGAVGIYPAGMTGAVYVGVSPTDQTGEVRHVPAEYPTIKAALNGIPPHSTVSLAPGTYNESVLAAAPDVTIHGEGDQPGDVVINGSDAAGHALTISSSNVTVEQLAVTGQTGAAIYIPSAARKFLVRDVETDGGIYGIEVAAGVNGAIRNAAARRAVVAGMAVQTCDPCGVAIEGGLVADSPTGVSVEGGTGVVLRGLTLTGDGVGVAVNDSQGVDVVGMAITGAATGVKLTSHSAPNLDVRVLDSSIAASGADLSWDLLGLRVCFSGNVDPAMPNGPTSSPPLAQTLFPCPPDG